MLWALVARSAGGSQDCPAAGADLTRAEEDLLHLFSLDAVLGDLRAAVDGGFGCGPIAQPADVARMLRLQGLVWQLQAEPPERVASAFRTARALDDAFPPELAEIGPEGPAAWASVGPVGAGTLSLRGLGVSEWVAIDGALSTGSATLEAGLHLVQVGVGTGPARHAALVLIRSASETLLAVPALPMPEPVPEVALVAPVPEPPPADAPSPPAPAVPTLRWGTDGVVVTAFSVDGRSGVPFTLDTSARPSFVEACSGPVGASCDLWEPIESPTVLEFPPTSRLRLASLHLRDTAGTTTGPIVVPVRIDTVAPQPPVAVARAGKGGVTVAWAGAAEGEGGVARYVVAGAREAVDSCGQGEVLFEGSGSSFVHSGVSADETWHYAVCAVDHAGNRSGPGHASVRLSPTAQFVRDVTFTSSSPTSTGSVAVSWTGWTASTACTSWRDTDECRRFLPIRGADLAVRAPRRAAPGLLSVWLRGEDGVVGPYVVSGASDREPPGLGQVVAEPVRDGNLLAWFGFVERRSRVASYVVAADPDRRPRCTEGVVWQGSDPTFTHPTDAPRTRYAVCAVDAAGNLSRPVFATVRR